MLSKHEAMKRALRAEIFAEIRNDGKVRDEVRRALDNLPRWTPFEDVTHLLSSPMVRQLGSKLTPDDLLKVQQALGTGNEHTRAFQNSRYFVHVTPEQLGGWRLSIKTLQNDARRDWREMQRIKNELCGPECEAVELYPAESRLVDSANQWYLFVFTAGVRLPFGFTDRMVVKPSSDGSGVNQRPWEPGTEPPDARDGTGDLEAFYRSVIAAKGAGEL